MSKPETIESVNIFPAYAGVNPGKPKQAWSKIDLPRVCGGEPRALRDANAAQASSPRMRG